MATQSVPDGMLRFGFQLLHKELDSMFRLAKKFLSPTVNHDFVFSSLKTQLDNIRLGDAAKRWATPPSQPLRTRSTKAYEPGGCGTHNVFGEVSWEWEIAPERRNSKVCEVRGIASIRSRILCADSGHELAMWRTELGDRNSPGCYFHQQVLGQHEQPPFPSSLSVPRLPSLLVTPMAAFEFLLGELFQDEWREHASRDNDDMKFWRSTQMFVLTQLLDWKKERIKACCGSPWIALKRAKPATDLFVEAR